MIDFSRNRGGDAPATIEFSRFREAGDPYWVDVLPAGEFLGLADKTILHSGPPIEFARMCLGHRRSMVNACFFEGWAKTEGEALKLLESGAVKCEAACDYATDGSGYGIITKSVPLLIVEDRAFGARAGLFPSEGKFGGGFCGWGVYTPEIAANLKWMGETLFAELVKVIQDAGGFPMRELFAEARRMGDELHSCQKAIDPLFTRAIIPYALKCRNAYDLLEYFATANRFTHNFGQAASRALLLGAEKKYIGGEGAAETGGICHGGEGAAETGGICHGGEGAAETGDICHGGAGATETGGICHGGALAAVGAGPFLTAAGGNGIEYGVKFAGSDRWFTAPSPMIEGPYLVPGAKRENQLPWIGDSSVTECRGWGGQIRAINPEVAAGSSPVINGGMMDVNGGWMGAGSTRIPLACFEKASLRLQLNLRA